MVKPSLATYFEQEVAKVYGNRPSVPSAMYKRFNELELELVGSGIRVWHYAAVVIRLWSWWVEEKELRSLPMNLFLGQASVRYYLKYRSKLSVEIVGLDLKKPMALYIEQEFANFYLAQRQEGLNVDETTAIEQFIECNQTNPDVLVWLEYCQSGRRFELVCNVIQHIMAGNMLYHSNEFVGSYPELFDVFLHNARKYLSEMKSKILRLYGRERIACRNRIDALEVELQNCNAG